MTVISERFHDVDGAILQIEGDHDYADFYIAQDGRSSHFEAKEDDLKRLYEALSATFAGDEPDPQATVPSPSNPANTNTTGNPRADWNTLAIHNASYLGLPIKFRYSKGNTGDIEERELHDVEPIETGKGWVVAGTDPDREEGRHFRIDWIKGYVQVKA